MPDSTTALKDDELLAAVDLGSNSFHMVVARHTLGEVRRIDKLRDMVRMAEGLDGRGGLRPDVMQRALDALSRFGQRVRDLPHHRVRAIATNTVRALRRPQAFLLPAETALGHPIEVVSGREEARLIYLGVAQGQPNGGQRRLVMDIGGGSTEFIIGENLDTLERESLQMGCVGTTRRFFGNGRLSRRKWNDALTEISAEFQQFATTYRELGWTGAIGSSGTIKTIGKIAAQIDDRTHGLITARAVAAIRERLLKADHVDAIDLPALPPERRAVIAGGLLVLEAAFNELGIESMEISKTAMREGVLFDMVGRATEHDPREGSINAMMRRYGVDETQAVRVEATALTLFEQAAEPWDLDVEDRHMLVWAARVHEVGLAIAHSQHHQHGAYLVQHSDIAGFTRNEQQLLATLVRCQRRAIPMEMIRAMPERQAMVAMKLIPVLRLAVLLHRSHDRAPLPALGLEVGPHQAALHLSSTWLDQHPLSRTDLETERELLAPFGLKFQIVATRR